MIFDATAFQNYILNPYLAKATEGLLGQRYDAVCANIWTAPPPGYPQLHTDVNKSAFWIAKLTEVRTERFIRSRKAGIFRGKANEFIGFSIDKMMSSIALSERILNSVRSLILPRSPFLVRFTEARFVQDALLHGRFQIAPAASYDDASLNPAQRDDELSHAAVRGDRHIAAQLIGYLPGESASEARPIPVQWGEMFQYMNSANFYVLCLTDQFDARMFHDFDKDAAIIIRDPAAFISRIISATRTDFPDLDFSAKPVRYYDPYTVKREELVAGFSKNFSFSYQSEFRPTWWPRDPRAPLSHFFLELGDLTDIAEAVYL